MHTTVNNRVETSALLFVRGIDDLSGVVLAVNDLLSWRRLHGAPDSEVLGIVVGDAVGASVMQPTCGGTLQGSRCLTVRESVGLSGIWSLRWFALASVEVCEDASERRHALLDVLLPRTRAHQAGTAPPIFVPAFTPAEARHDVAVLIEDIKARYPAVIIGHDWFVGDPMCGSLVPICR